MTYPKKVHMERVSFTHPKPLPTLKTTSRKKESHHILSQALQGTQLYTTASVSWNIPSKLCEP